MNRHPHKMQCLCYRITITGVVQGIGFRPFIYTLAQQLGLTGWVMNTGSGVTIRAQGNRENLDRFIKHIRQTAPVQSQIHTLHYERVTAQEYSEFSIRHSHEGNTKTALILPDLATCPSCLDELFNPHDRRYLYPFTNCTHCGPRFSIITDIPYDRRNTTMRQFQMCAACEQEYMNPKNRRFHAQPNACPACGPQCAYWDQKGQLVASRHEAVQTAVQAIKEGKIIAVKGIGGFHLMCDARSSTSVEHLRTRKQRDAKPFAVMFPDMASVDQCCFLSDEERSLLTSHAAPIVLLAKKATSMIADAVAPHNHDLGVLLPYSPLHSILMHMLQCPVIATSANISEEPICIDEHEALHKLNAIADGFLIHNRPIARSMDDSVLRCVMGKAMMLRRSRGFAPLPIPVEPGGPAILAVGGHLKNTVALHVNGSVFLSPHIGDLISHDASVLFQQSTRDLPKLYTRTPQHIAHDLHPDYRSTQYAQTHSAAAMGVQHHHAHIAACMAEHGIHNQVLGIAWDGSGWGNDRTVWGGEFLHATYTWFDRVAHFAPFALPGGELAVREPRRAAVAILHQCFGNESAHYSELPAVRSFSPEQLCLVRRMLARRLNSPETSSVGRLFDAVASLLDICHVNTFEGQAAMHLEFLASQSVTESNYPYQIQENNQNRLVVHWQPMITAILNDLHAKVSKTLMAAKFHNTLVEIAVALAKQTGEQDIVLSGGCFQNKYLAERMIQRLRNEHFNVYWPQSVPPNDGGIALGQAVVALHQLKHQSDQDTSTEVTSTPRKDFLKCV